MKTVCIYIYIFILYLYTHNYQQGTFFQRQCDNATRPRETFCIICHICHIYRQMQSNLTFVYIGYIGAMFHDKWWFFAPVFWKLLELPSCHTQTLETHWTASFFCLLRSFRNLIALRVTFQMRRWGWQFASWFRWQHPQKKVTYIISTRIVVWGFDVLFLFLFFLLPVHVEFCWTNFDVEMIMAHCRKLNSESIFF